MEQGEEKWSCLENLPIALRPAAFPPYLYSLFFQLLKQVDSVKFAFFSHKNKSSVSYVKQA